jgi:hypothetical protein
MIDSNMDEGEDEDQVRQRLMRVDDYTEDEIQEDINLVDWDFAYGEILKLEERKKSKLNKEADQKLQEERVKIEEALRIKYEQEQ